MGILVLLTWGKCGIRTEDSSDAQEESSLNVEGETQKTILSFILTAPPLLGGGDLFLQQKR